MSFGVCLFKYSGQGNDPYNAMNMAVSAYIGMPYATYQMIFNLSLLVIEFIFARKMIGFGTFFNSIVVGYIVTFFYDLLAPFMVFESFAIKLVVLLVGVLCSSLGLAIYQHADCGLAPYDSLPFILERWIPKVPYFWRRMIFDGSATLICFLTGGIIGIGTVISTFGLGTFIAFFDWLLFWGKRRRKMP